MKILLLVILVALFSCQNENPYLVEKQDTTYTILNLIDTVYIHDTIIDAIYKPKKKSKITEGKPYWPLHSNWEGVTVSPTTTPELSNDYFDSSWEVVKKPTTIEINDTLSGGQYSVTKVGGIQDENVELNYSLDNQIQIGWNGKKWEMCGMSDWGDCNIHTCHKTLREILDSTKSKQ